MKYQRVTILLALLAVVILMTACSSGVSKTTPTATTPQDGATLVQERCSKCHPVGRIEQTPRTATEWKAIVDVMISRGAQLTSDEETVVVNYLAANYGK
jgi:uncharacterized protein YceK